jgi:hypothetical protein
MPSSRVLISSQTLGSAAASVTFSSIPATYTDLVVRVSGRGTNAGVTGSLLFRFNGDSSTIYSRTRLWGDGSSATSDNSSGSNEGNGLSVNGNTSTSNTFGSAEIYIPSYTVSQNKPLSVFSATENNATSANIGAIANLYRSTSAITSILLYTSSGTDWMSGSSFYLYGLRSS